MEAKCRISTSLKGNLHPLQTASHLVHVDEIQLSIFGLKAGVRITCGTNSLSQEQICGMDKTKCNVFANPDYHFSVVSQFKL